MKRTRFGFTTYGGILLLAIGLSGCSDGGKKPKKIHTVQGVAKKIDLKNNYVAMMFVDKEGKERMLEGTVKEDTDVVINGRASKLEDVREGDKVTVAGYKDSKDDELKFVATRVEVTRAAGNDWKPTASGSKPATTQPAKP